MLVKVLGSIGDRPVNEIFNLSDNSRGEELKAAVRERLEGVDVELFCMGRALSDSDIVPSGCVIHMRVVTSDRAPDFQGPDSSEEPLPSSDSERNPEEIAEILYDEEARPAQVLGQNWNDPQVIAAYRRRLRERGVNPEVAQRKLDQTLRVIKKYQHFVLFYVVLTAMEFLAWPALCHRITDPGSNPVDLSNKTAWQILVQEFDYIEILNLLWWFSVLFGLFCLLGALAGEQGSGICVKIHRAFQYIFIAFNVYFLIGSGLKLPPFDNFILKGSWVSMACAVILGSAFRVARLFVSYRYMAVYKSLQTEERQYAHQTMVCSVEIPQQPQEQDGAAPAPVDVADPGQMV